MRRLTLSLSQYVKGAKFQIQSMSVIEGLPLNSSQHGDGFGFGYAFRKDSDSGMS